MTAAGSIGGVAGELEAVRRAYEEDLAAEEQLSLLEPVTAEEMVLAREALGANAGTLSLVNHARQQRKAGRPAGSRNKRTSDFAKMLALQGPDPMIGAYRLANTQPEVLIEASKQEKVHSFDKHNTPRIVIERMTYAEALAIIMRARELIAPYLHGKVPVAVDMNIRGIRVIEEIGGAAANDVVDGEFVRVAGPGEGEDGADAA